MEICFLLGAGISRNILKTDIHKITNSLFEDEWFERNDVFHKAEKDIEEDPIVSNYKKFLSIISGYLMYKTFIDQPNYEHLFNVCDQIKRSNESAKSNLLAVGQIEELVNEANGLIEEDVRISSFTKNVCKYVKSVVLHHLIHGDSNDFNYTNLFQQLKNHDIKGHIFTLNHDLLLEKHFRHADISYNDFFTDDYSKEFFIGDESKKQKEIRKFLPDEVGNIEGCDFGLYKLHGSINWVRYTQDFFGFYSLDYFDDDLMNELTSVPFQTVSSTAEFITGHTNKSMDYFHGIYTLLTSEFIRRLYESELLIVSGFGWKDYVIRQIIMEWLDQDDTRKMILAYENDTDPRNFLGSRNIDNHSRIDNAKKWLSDLEFSDIKDSVS